jgi:FKBP-type peptidyl-prolyl cis-trans isomerase (trigger factor)
MLLDRVAQIENIEVADGEVEEELTKMADYYRSSLDEVRESLEKQGGGIESIRNNLKTRKSIEVVMEKVTVKQGEWVDESTMPVEAEEKPKKAAKKKKAAKEA